MEKEDIVVPRYRLSLMHLFWTFVLLSSLWNQSHAGGDTVQAAPRGGWSVWSVCSAHCGYGISTRSRQCPLGDDGVQGASQGDPLTCPGAGYQTKACNLKPCPLEETSRNQKSCSEFDSRMFSGKQYVWEPIIHMNAACKMSCRAKGLHFYANLADRAEDGTPCKLGTTDAICVTGVCKRVGCDGVVESTAVKDICGLCSGDGSTCETISGIFTSTELNRGINHVISIPAGSTNINITELQASRNLLVLQTGAGTTFINNDTRNPTSAVVEAAGTVFTYSTKSALVQKESIFSPGPTNTSVILKLLMRGRNPGIMYTFSVPREVSGSIIKQIRHHSRPVELSPELNEGRDEHYEALSSKREDPAELKNHPVKPSSTESPSMSPFIEEHARSSLKQNKHLEGVTDIISNDKSTSPSFFEILPTAFDSSNNDVDGDIANNDIIPNLSENDHTLDGLSTTPHEYTLEDMSITPPSQSTADVVDVTETHTINHRHDLDLQQTTEPSTTHSTDEDKYIHLHDGDSAVAENVEHEGVSSAKTTMEGVVLDNEINENDSNSSSVNNVTEHPNSVIANRSALVNTIENSDENNHKLSGSNDSQTSIEGELLQGQTQSWNNIPDSTNVENYNFNNESDINPEVTGGQILRSTVEPSTLNTFDNRQQDKVTQTKPSQNVGNKESIERSEEPFSKHKKAHSNYKIPKYSQSFTFAERYKDNYGANNSSSSLHRQRSQHARRHHSQQKSSHQISPNEQNDHSNHKNPEHGSQSQRRHLNENPNRNTGHVRAKDSDLPVVNNVEYKNTVDPSKATQTERRAQHITPDRYQRDRDQRLNKESQDRQVIMDERQRRMEEQRIRYKQRLDEYNEKLRQRQVEMDERSRRRALDASKTSNHRNSVRHRGSHHHGTNHSTPSSREEFTSNNEDGHSSGSARKQHSPDTARLDTHKGTHATGRTHVNSDNTHMYTNSKHAVAWPANDRQQERLGRLSSEYPQTDLSTNRQTVHQSGRREGYVKDGSHTHDIESDRYTSDSRTRDRQANRGVAHAQRGSPNGPVVIQPPSLEYPENVDGVSVNSHSSRIIPRVHQPAPRYIPAGQSRSAFHSALTGVEGQQESASNKISSDNHISPSRQSAAYNQVGSPDIISNHIPLNKLDPGSNIHSAIYEWRISGLTACTHSCGGGVQQTVVVCVDTLTQAVVTDENCRHIPKPKLTGVACNTRPCSAEWTPGPWSSCSVTCGKGEQTRSVTCQARVSPTLSMTMPTSHCENQEQITSRQACSNKPCSSWRVGLWSNCSTPCGDGHRTRDVQCVDQQGNVVSDDACSELMPDSEEMCSLGECGKGWFFTEWPTECPAECGTGEVTRTVFCADDAGSALPDSRCDSSQRPAVSQPCRVSRPCGGLWFTGQWSKCDARCGSGNKRRTVMCIKELSGGVRAVVDEENCQELNKPAQLEECQATPCVPEWYMTSWSQCSQSCGTGYRTREVKCLDPDQKPSDCPLQSRPKTKDACNTHSCADVEANENEENADCVNKFAQCNIVKRARLCQYAYYKTACCKSCADDT